MSTQAMPPIPPRPARSQEQQSVASNGSTLGSEFPKIPPRPINRRIERSQSPHRDSYARSPLNEPSFMPTSGANGKSQSYGSSPNNSSSDVQPRRPVSIVLPSIGQEGNEYDDAFNDTLQVGSSPPETRSIANDLKLHAPKPSLPSVSAKQRISNVTRTDSGQAAALGIGKANSDDKDPQTRSIRPKTSSVSIRSSNAGDRPLSIVDDELIPEIGQRVPMYPNAGDVQAPSPSPYNQQFPVGIGFHNDGSKIRHHGRKHSGKGFDVPPGAYGLHGHGLVQSDRFEKAYYEKHPELLKKETGHYIGVHGEGRGEWAMSTEDLNKIVRDTASRGSGPGTGSEFVSTPSEQIGFLASEEYASRMSSPKPQSGTPKKAPSNSSQTHADSPLRSGSSQTDTAVKAEFEGEVAKGLHASSIAAESEVEDDDTVHVDAPEHRSSKVYSSSYEESTEDLGRHDGSTSGNGGFAEELGYSVPILASDEVAKEPFGYELQPAVSPLQERHGGFYDNEGLYRTTSATSSHPPSRPTSIHGGIRQPSDYDHGHSTPLDDVNEYEPLFAEEEKQREKPLTAADKLKARPELKNRRFPSQDIWEDSPDSLQYTATVSTPQLPDEDTEDNPTTHASQVREGETPEQAFARKQEELAESESQSSDSFLSREKKPQPWAQKSYLVGETRPGLKQRFPSRDIWEDSPDSLQLETTVSGPQLEESAILSPNDEKDTIDAEGGHATTGTPAALKPAIPARPIKQKPETSAASPVAAEVPSPTATKPTIPDRPKPVVPARPSRPISRESSDTVPLTQATSAGSDVAVKAKPPVPSRPVGSKIAALQGGFMLDLNKRLQLGPQAPKKEELVPEAQEEEKEKAPLADARKGRARGPARRAPAKSPAPADTTPAAPGFSFSSPITTWHINPDEGVLSLTSHKSEAPVVEAKAVKSEASTTATATAAEPVHAPSPIVSDEPAIEAEAEADEESYEAMAGSTATIKPVDEAKASAPVEEKEVATEEPAKKVESENKVPGSFE